MRVGPEQRGEGRAGSRERLDFPKEAGPGSGADGAPDAGPES